MTKLLKLDYGTRKPPTRTRWILTILLAIVGLWYIWRVAVYTPHPGNPVRTPLYSN
jgi:hypothetical protein